MDEVERLAASPSFGAKSITLNTMLGKNQASAAWHESVGLHYIPGTRVNQHWYQKRGYSEYKVSPRYHWTNPKSGDELVLEAVVSQFSCETCTPLKFAVCRSSCRNHCRPVCSISHAVDGEIGRAHV